MSKNREKYNISDENLHNYVVNTHNNEALAELNLIRDRLNKLENETKRLT